MTHSKTGASPGMGRTLRLLGKASASLSLLAAGASLFAFSSTPVQAQPACVNGGTISYLVGLTSGCQIGDKVYSNFAFSPNWGTTGTFNFTNSIDTDHTFSGAGLSLLTGTYTYSYKMTATASQLPFQYRTDLGTSGIDPVSATNELANSSNLLKSSAGVPGASPGNLVFLTPSSGVSPVTFSGTLTVSTGRIDTITDSVRQTPGPLPILGAGAAFGFSRKLRGRIKAARLG